MYPLHIERHRRASLVNLTLEEHARGYLVQTPSELQPLYVKIEERMRVLGYPSKDIFAVLLALDEAVVNAHRHGNRGDRTKSICLRYLVTADEVLVEVEDEGRGFDPEQVASPLTEGNVDRPGGRGLFLMRAYMSWVNYNRAGNRVTLARRRSQS